MVAGDVHIDDRVSPEDEAAVVRGLLAFNENWIGPSNEKSVKLVARDDQGIVGGFPFIAKPARLGGSG